MTTMLRTVFLAFLLTLAGAAGAEPRLIMVDQPGCIYCQRWHAQIGPAYPKTPEGAFAPLWVVDLGDTPPDGVTLARKVRFTPTFILVEDGKELARIEGYPGEDFFWGLLENLLKQHTDYTTGAS